MPQLLLELFSEEIPARMQKRAEEDLARAFGEKLKAAGLDAKAIKTFSSPRRLGLVIDELPAKAADVNEEKKGPRVGAPDQAIQGFLKSAGLSSIDQAQVVEDKKGAFYVAKIERAGRATAAIVQEIIPEIVRAFPWPKSMRSGESDLTWVRPLHNVLCLFDGAPVKIEIEGVGSKPETFGHRFHGQGAIKPRDFADYAAKLRDAKVLIDREERKAIILEQARKLCADKGLELVEDLGLLEEVCGLVEWPVTLLGDMDPAFLDLPGEVIRLSMRTHQKYFAVRDPKNAKLAPHFITVANVEAKDGGKAIAAGNARVLSARLNDARFFWDTDKKTPLYTDERKAKLEKIVFHQKLGSVWDKVSRVRKLADFLCVTTGADKALVKEAVRLSKCDLVTETVGEFPELQGQVGKELVLIARGDARVANAVEDHYRPVGPSDRIPTEPVAVTLALADKLDTLAGFWAINEKPTGSSDPYALRRAALGFISIVLSAEVRMPLRLLARLQILRNSIFVGHQTIDELDRKIGATSAELEIARRRVERAIEELPAEKREAARQHWEKARQEAHESQSESAVAPDETDEQVQSLLAFLADRLKVQLRDQGKRHDLVDAVFALGDDDLVRIVARVEALDAFLKTEDGANLLAGYKRAANILSAEEKKGRGLTPDDEAIGVKQTLLKDEAEQMLWASLQDALPTARSAVEKEDFASAMKSLARLRAPVDEFLDKVFVNAPEDMLRRNRLLLLSRLREALSAVADFSKIEG